MTVWVVTYPYPKPFPWLRELLVLPGPRPVQRERRGPQVLPVPQGPPLARSARVLRELPPLVPRAAWRAPV